MESVWCGLSESKALAPLTRWRDAALAPAVAKLPSLQSLQHYTAFNLPCTMTVATFDADQPRTPSVVVESGIDFKSVGAVKSSEFRQPGLTDPIDAAPILYSVLFTVPQAWHAEFDDWYDQEHMPMILACKHWGMTRRYRLPANVNGWTHLALHYILDAKAFDAPELKAARLTPWRAKFLKERWFTDVDKMIYFKQAAETPAALQQAS